MSSKESETLEEERQKVVDREIAELKKMLLNAEPMKNGEYARQLYEIRHRAAINLNMLLLDSKTVKTGAFANVLDKVHWLIVDLEKRGEAREIEKTQKILGWKYPEPEKEPPTYDA
jgi:hypothetical protein